MRTLHYTTDTARTGGGLCFALRPDMFEGHAYVDGAARFNSDLGCLDAPPCLPGGATVVEETVIFRFVGQRFIPRA